MTSIANIDSQKPKSGKKEVSASKVYFPNPQNSSSMRNENMFGSY